MKIIDVCDHDAAAGVLKLYYEKNGIGNYNIIPFNLYLSLGDLKNNRLSFLRKIYQDDNFVYNSWSIKKLLDNINNDTKVRIWSSKRNDDDYLLLLYLCDLLKDKINNISVIFCSDYKDIFFSINCTNPQEIKLLLKYEKKLSIHDIKKYSNKWKELVNINSELRILENGVVKNKNYSDYFDIILNYLKKIAPCTIAHLIGELMGNYIINDAGDLLYLFIIDQLIDLNRIKIVEKGQRHFVDIIE